MATSKVKRMLWTDTLLIPSFIGTVYTGVKLHIASHVGTYGTWVLPHMLISLLMLILGVIHIRQHWNWYKGLFRVGKAKRSKTTVVLSLFFLLTVLTGIADMFDETHTTSLGSIHTLSGLAVALVGLPHIIGRFPWMIKAFGKS